MPSLVSAASVSRRTEHGNVGEARGETTQPVAEVPLETGSIAELVDGSRWDDRCGSCGRQHGVNAHRI